MHSLETPSGVSESPRGHNPTHFTSPEGPRGQNPGYSTRFAACGELHGPECYAFSESGRPSGPETYVFYEVCGLWEASEAQNPMYFTSPEGLRGHIPTYFTRVGALGEAGARDEATGCGLGLRVLFLGDEPPEGELPRSRACLLRARSPFFVGGSKRHWAGSLERSARRHGLRSCNARGSV